ncbi:hypothetical protein [Candidatus Coxiella mudrowiae]|uniref:hypothetical protein n=1 Tax=Candidatus Coxiella mudrowiae TaxID=2054173 RepID=UPI0012FF470E|nr:hypothetical protein [Candidatus Coxiella mudrowiae]
MFCSDGQKPVYHFVIGPDFLTGDQFNFRWEVVGVQNGNTMRLVAPEIVPDKWGLPINSIVKPMLDFLLTLRSGRFGSSCLFVKLKKGGVLTDVGILWIVIASQAS